ncbi:MAG TPA: hypothetical protein VF719_02180, partial [Abditibacteriaceae bacterium]
MAKSRAQKQREAEAVLNADPAADHGGNAFAVILAGAMATVVVLFVLKFGVRELWSPFGATGSLVFRGLLASSVAGALVATFLARGSRVPLAAMAVALGWGIFGLYQHVIAPASYIPILRGTMKVGPDISIKATHQFLLNAAFQPIVIAFGFIL